MWARRGFTYLEMAVVMALFAIFLALGVGLARQAHGRPSSRSAAEVLCAFLRAQREHARAVGQPVAVVWPGQLSSACEALEGWDNPHRIERLELAGDFPQTRMFMGRWNTLSSSFTDTRPLWGGRDDDWDPGQYPRERALIFLPSGKVTARGCPRLQDNYLLVVGKNLGAEADVLLSGENAFTVRVSPAGWCDWSHGLVDGNLAAAGGSAPLSNLGPFTSASGGPVLRGLTLRPDPTRLNLPPGIDALVDANGFLSLTMEADCPSGQTLYCQWTGLGAFSSTDRRPMNWDPAARRWRCETHWRPPDAAGNGARYQLTCHVTDESGREAPQTLTSQVNLEVRDEKARMAFINVAAAPDNSHLMQIVNEDGTGKRELLTRVITAPGEAPKASWSPDGTRLAYLSQGGLWTCNGDGSAPRRLDQALPGTAVALQGAHWSPDGTWLAHVRRLAPDRQQVCLVHPDGSGYQNLNSGSSSDSFVVYFTGSGSNSNVVSRDNSVFSGDGKWLATIVSSTLDRSTQTHIQCYALPGSGASPVSIPLDNFSWSVVFNPEQPWLAFSSGGGLKIYDLAAGQFFAVPPAQDQYAGGPGCFSPDGNRYLFGRGADLFVAELDGTAHTVEVTPLQVSGQMMGWLDDERFTYWRENPSDMLVRDRQDGSEQNLTNQGSDAMFCGWSKP